MRFFTALAILAISALYPSMVMAQDRPDEQQSVSDEPPEEALSDETDQPTPEPGVQQSEPQDSNEVAGELDSATIQRPTGPPRDYSACLGRLIQERVSDRMSANAFTSTARRACASEERAFRQSAATYEIATGARRADAEERAEAEVQDLLNNAANVYSNSLPQ